MAITYPPTFCRRFNIVDTPGTNAIIAATSS